MCHVTDPHRTHLLQDFFSQKHSDAFEQVENFSGQEEHKAKMSHELIGAAAAFEAAKAYQDHERKEGKPASHALAKELFAGFMGAAVDRVRNCFVVL